MTSSRLEASLGLSAQGCPVFPLKPGQKTPATPNGFKDATCDPDQIRAWWGTNPDFNIGVPTGAQFHVLDVDGLDGANAIEEWADTTPLRGRAIPQHTPMVATPSGGYHVWLKPIDGAGNRAGMVEHVDFRGDGGYVVVPPSTVDGKDYVWIEPFTGPDSLKQATEPLKDLVLRRPVANAQQTSPRSLHDRLAAQSRAGDQAGGDYAHTAMERELADLSCAPSGTRNHSLNRAAFSIFQLCEAGLLDVQEAAGRLRQTAASIGLDTLEVERTLLSAAGAAERSPRSPARLPQPSSPSIRPSTSPADTGPVVDPATGELLPPEGYEEFAAKLISTASLLALKPPEPLIEGILVRDSLAALYGQPGSMKSFLAIDWAMCVAKGRWWKGHPVVQGGVLYVIAEGKAGAGSRVRAWQEFEGLPNEPEHLEWYPEAGNLLNWEWVQQLAWHVRQTKPVLVVVDTLSRSMPGGDENDSVDMTTVVRQIDTIRRAAGSTVLLVHHTPKESRTLRGHSSLHGAMDTEIETVKSDGKLTVHNAKQKDAEEFRDIELWWKKVEWGAEGDRRHSIVLVTEPQAQEFDRVGPNGEHVFAMLRAKFRQTGASMGLLAGACGLTDLEVYEAVNRLIDEGRVRPDGQRYKAL